MDCAEQENDPDRFFKEVCESLLLDLPWVVGRENGRRSPMDAGTGTFGKQSSYWQEYLNMSLVLTGLYTAFVEPGSGLARAVADQVG